MPRMSGQHTEVSPEFLAERRRVPSDVRSAPRRRVLKAAEVRAREVVRRQVMPENLPATGTDEFDAIAAAENENKELRARLAEMERHLSELTAPHK